MNETEETNKNHLPQSNAEITDYDKDTTVNSLGEEKTTGNSKIDLLPEEDVHEKGTTVINSKEESLNTDTDIFNVDKVIKYSSDEETDDSGSDSDGDSDSDSDGNSDNSGEGEEKSESVSESESESDEENAEDDDKYDDLEDEINEGDGDAPIVSKNEILDFKVPSIPDDYKIDENSKIQYIGFISGVVDKSVLVKATMSAEYNVLNEGTVFCYEDRTPVGLLYEVIGRLQTPIYTIRFNTLEEAEKFKDKKGTKIFYVESTAEFLSTQQIRQYKGTDASNWHDEEIPEDEQEFSDDEKEALSKKNKKKKKKTNLKNHEDEKSTIDDKSGMSDAHVSKKPKTNGIGRTDVPMSVKARLTSLPKKVSHSESNSTNGSQVSSFLNVPPQIPQQQNTQIPVAMMQQFMGLMQQASMMTQPNAAQYNNISTQQNGQVYGQQNQQQFGFPYGQQYNQQFNTQQYTSPYNSGYNNQGYQNQAAYNQFNTAHSQPVQSFSQGYNSTYQAQPSVQAPVYNQNIQQNLPPQHLPQQSNTALLAAQLAAAITNSSSNSRASVNSSYNKNEQYQPDDEYDPEN